MNSMFTHPNGHISILWDILDTVKNTVVKRQRKDMMPKFRPAPGFRSKNSDVPMMRHKLRLNIPCRG